MKPIEYLGTIFFDLMRIQPRETFFTTSLFLARSIVILDKKEKEKSREDTSINDKHLKDLNYIRENTHKDLLKPLGIVEAIVASKDREEWGSEYGGRNNKGESVILEDGRRASILDLYMYLKEAYAPMVMAVVDIVKDYSADFRMSMMGANPNMDFLNSGGM